MSIKSFAAAGVVALAISTSAVQQANAAIQVFTDFGAWLTAVGDVAGSFTTETFNTNSITVPGLSFTSDNGSIGSGRFNDVAVPSAATTTWSFGGSAVAFGGFWNLAVPGGPGTGLQLSLIDASNAVTLVPSEISNSTNNGFFGVLSDNAFVKVLVTNGTQANGVETYQLDNLSFASAVTNAVPEPATWAMMLIGFAGLGYAARRRRNAAA